MGEDLYFSVNMLQDNYILHAYRENRYLLFLTENYAALDILKHYIRGKDHEPSTTGDAKGSTVSQKPLKHIRGKDHDPSTTGDTEGSTVTKKPFTLFGSSFPKDREYTQVL